MVQIVRDVTRESFADVAKAYNLRPGQRFTIIIDEERKSESGSMENGKGNVADRFLALAGVGGKCAPPRSIEEIDALIRENRGDE